MSYRLSERNDKFMTALQFLADSSANDAIREKLREFPNRVYFPNFGKGDNIFKEGIDIDRVLFTVPGTNFKIYWYGFLITIGILLAMIYGFRRMKTVGMTLIERQIPLSADLLELSLAQDFIISSLIQRA